MTPREEIETLIKLIDSSLDLHADTLTRAAGRDLDAALIEERAAQVGYAKRNLIPTREHVLRLAYRLEALEAKCTMLAAALKKADEVHQ